jgi:hypothetical protein
LLRSLRGREGGGGGGGRGKKKIKEKARIFKIFGGAESKGSEEDKI